MRLRTRPPLLTYLLARGIYGGGFRKVVALKALLLEAEKVGDPVRPLCHLQLLEGGGGVFVVCDGWVFGVKGKVKRRKVALMGAGRG